MKLPKVSVCIASYNHGRYIAETLSSILAQTYQDFEIVIVDDESTDDSVAIIEQFVSQYPDKIRFYQHADRKNHGVSRTTNLAIEKSRGQYIAFIGSDDVWLDNLLLRGVTILDFDQEIGLVYGKTRSIDANGNFLERVLGFDLTGNVVAGLILGNCIPAMTVITRRNLLDRIGLFKEMLIYSDWELWIRIACSSRIFFIDEVLAFRREHGDNLSLGSVQKDAANNIAVLDELEDQDCFNEFKEFIWFRKSNEMIKAGNYDEASKLLNKVLLTSLGKSIAYNHVGRMVGYFWDSGDLKETCFLGFAKTVKSLFFRNKLFGNYYAAGVFVAYRSKDFARVRKSFVKSIFYDPSNLLNKGLISVFLKTFGVNLGKRSF